MMTILGVFLFVVAFTGTAAAQRFEGTLELIPPGCEKQLKCTVKNEFGFVDQNGVGWQARAGLETDGASIPGWAQPIIGGQFERDYIRAAVIHDHYCDRHVRPWRQTHRVFHEALLASGVSNGKAMLMYFAVYLGGPKWVKLIEGKACQTGEICIQQVPNQQWPRGTSRRKIENNDILRRPAQYDDPSFGKHLESAKELIDARGQAAKIEDLEKLAESIKVGDFFYRTTEEKIVLVPSQLKDR
jgi:hypothetical protein